MNIEIDTSQFEKSLKNATIQIIDKCASNLDKACLVVAGSAKKNCPVDEGILRASITSEVKRGHTEITGCIGSNVEYAPYVHEGTGIYAKSGNGRKTPWMWQGHSVKYRGWHKTVGQRPNPFLEKAILQNKDKITMILAKE